MSVRRICQHILILCYLAVTSAAFLFTMTRIEVPFLPQAFVHFSYGMMAPFQGYQIHNEELEAEGLLPDGTWAAIDLDPYFPFLRGEANVRGYLPGFRGERGEVPEEKYRELAEGIRRLESERGRDFSSVRLLWAIWPESPAGFYFLKKPPFTERTLLIQVP